MPAFVLSLSKDPRSTGVTQPKEPEERARIQHSTLGISINYLSIGFKGIGLLIAGMAFSALFTLVAVAAFPAVIHAVGVGSVLVGCLVLVVVLGEYRHRAQPADAEQARHDAH